MIRAYLDWNIITNLRNCDEDEKVDPRYKEIKSLIDGLEEHLFLPYSNAHINDIISNYKKGERVRVDLSLQYLWQLTKGICICLYWNEESAKIHYRKPQDLFEDVLADIEDNTIDTFENYISSLLKHPGGDKYVQVLKDTPHHVDFEIIKKASPFFVSLFPNACNDSRFIAFFNDIYNLIFEVQNNPIIYSELRKIFKDGFQINPHLSTLDNTIVQLDKLFPKTLLNKSFTELYNENNPREYTKAKVQSRLTGLYMQLDFVGFNSEKISEKNKYGNLFNDALHCYYAAHFDFYVTNDKRGAKKSNAVYESEGITTKVLNIDEFIALLKDLKEKLPVKPEILLPQNTEMNWIKKVFQKWIYRRKIYNK